jgi:hypothetical protein
MADAATRQARRHVHSLLDPVWQSGGMGRAEAYAWFSEMMGGRWPRVVHVGDLTLAECERAAVLLRDALIAVDFG